MKTLPTVARFALMQYAGTDNQLKTFDLPALGFSGVVLVNEGKKLDPKEHAGRMAAQAKKMKAGEVLVANCEGYADNISAAEMCVRAAKQANPDVLVSAYVTEQTLDHKAGAGWMPFERSNKVHKVLECTARLAEAGADFASIDGYQNLSPDGVTGIRDYNSASPLECWKHYVSEAATLVEFILPPVIWLSNRFHQNGVEIPAPRLEPFIPPNDVYAFYTFLEARGWSTIGLFGWSDLLKQRTTTPTTPGRGFLPYSALDKLVVEGLKNVPIQTRPNP